MGHGGWAEGPPPWAARPSRAQALTRAIEFRFNHSLGIAEAGRDRVTS